MVALSRIPAFMTADEFLAWNPPGTERWQLLDGEPCAMAPASRTHGTLQAELTGLIRAHLLERARPCSVVIAPGIVPRVRSELNVRIPDLAVTCSGYEQEETTLEEPVLIAEILSPSNKAETWANVWTYVTIPSVQEILVLDSTKIGAELLRRLPDGSWPEQSQAIGADEALTLQSIGFSCPLRAVYRATRLAR
jgi:Uma2 family endonuclease